MGFGAPRRTADAEQTADHILASCPLYHPPNGTLGLGGLASNNRTLHLMNQSAQTKKQVVGFTEKIE